VEKTAFGVITRAAWANISVVRVGLVMESLLFKKLRDYNLSN